MKTICSNLHKFHKKTPSEMFDRSLDTLLDTRITCKRKFQIFTKITTQKTKFSIKNFFSKCDQTAFWSHLTEKILNEKLHFLHSECEILNDCQDKKRVEISRTLSNICDGDFLQTLLTVFSAVNIFTEKLNHKYLSVS